MRVVHLFVYIAVFALAGCAGSAPKATFVQPLKKEAIVNSNDSAVVTVTAGPGVEMLSHEIARLSEVITQKLNEKKSVNAASADGDAYEVEVNVTRYKKGNAFARAMLAGLGQIHLDARVRLLSAGDREQLSAFDIKKTFAWGGIYGGTTRIDDIEPAFAEGIAAALTGTADASELQGNAK